MTLLSEYALTPDVFDSTSYSGTDLCDVHLQYLKEALLNDALVRNLREGAWLQVFQDPSRPWHPRGKELLKKLVSQRRFRISPAAMRTMPTMDLEWCNEAIASHSAVPLRGIVVTDAIASGFSGNELVAPISKLSNSSWWMSRGPSVPVARTKAAYQNCLDLLLKCANSLMFIDAHFDPSLARYKDFVSIIATMGSRSPKPRIELHRVCYVSSSNKVLDSTMKDRFIRGLQPLCAVGLQVDVFFWDDFHDRHVISDLIGLGLQNGLDTTAQLGAMTMWHRLSRSSRDDIQREFDPASHRHVLRERFQV